MTNQPLSSAALTLGIGSPGSTLCNYFRIADHLEVAKPVNTSPFLLHFIGATVILLNGIQACAHEGKYHLCT